MFVTQSKKKAESFVDIRILVNDHRVLECF